MKKKFIPLLLLSLLITACGPSSGSSTPSSSSQETVITGVEVAGEQSLEVGDTTTLVVDVIGSDTDEVTWSSSDNTIATVSSEGVVAAIDEGTVQITATSVENPAFSGSISLNIYYPNIKAVKIVVEEIEGLYFDKDSNSYNVALGRPFKIDFEVTNPSFYKEPTFVNYKVTLPSNIPDNTIFTLDPIPETTTRIAYTYGAVNNAVVTLEVGYEGTEIPHLTDVAIFNVIDINAPHKEHIMSEVEKFRQFEKDNVTEVQIHRQKSTKTNDDILVNKTTIKGNSYIGSSYSQNSYEETLNSDVVSSSNRYFHHSISKEHYISFEADENDHIIQLFDNKSVSKNEGIEEQVKYIPLFYEGTLKMGLGEVLESYFKTDYTTIDKNIVTFGNSNIYAFSEFTYEKDSLAVESVYTDSNNVTYTVMLSIKYTNENISGFTFYEMIEDENQTIEFAEVVTIKTGTKLDDNSSNNDHYINTNNYYYSTFEVEDFHGKKENPQGGYIYDYSNDDKYGVDYITEEEGLVKYTLTYDKALILKIKNPTPSTANSLIDKIVAVSSDETQIASVETIGEDLFAINPLKDDNNLAKPGKATFTFTSRSKATYQIIVEFISKDLQGILIRGIESTDMGEIYENTHSNYFYLNPIPDEDKYTFGINIISGPENGITLNKWAYDNEFGYPGFSYYIQGVEPGEYTFEFYVVEEPTITSETTYTIKVIEVKTNAEIEALIVGQTFKYATQNNTHVATLTFDTNTQITFESQMLGMDKVSTTLTYSINEGKVFIEDNPNNVLAEGFYWSEIIPGEMYFNNEFDQVQVKFSDSTAGGDTTVGSYYVTFTKTISSEDINDFENYINGKTFSLDTTKFITGSGMSNVDVKFKDGVGTLTITPVNNPTSPVVLTFNYTYLSGTNLSELSLTNITSTNALYSMNSTASVDIENASMTFKVVYNGISITLQFPLS